jgi:hypothetical protein
MQLSGPVMCLPAEVFHEGMVLRTESEKMLLAVGYRLLAIGYWLLAIGKVQKSLICKGYVKSLDLANAQCPGRVRMAHH